MSRRIALISLAIFGILLGGAWMTPDTWYVERFIDIEAPPELIWEYVATPGRWVEWTAWNPEADADYKVETFGGTQGFASGYRWTSARSVGELRIIDSDPPQRIELEGLLEKRFPVQGSIELSEGPSGTHVLWIEQGELGWDPLMRLFRPLIERHTGWDFDTGLETLKELAEAEARERVPHPDAPTGTYQDAGDDDDSAGAPAGDDDSAEAP